jgi:hypothetical protein
MFLVYLVRLIIFELLLAGVIFGGGIFAGVIIDWRHY